MAIAKQNVSTPYYSEGEDLTCIVITGAVTGKTFVDVTANRATGGTATVDALNADTTGNNYKVTTCGAAGKPLGVASYDGAIGDIITVQGQPGRVCQVTAGGTIAAGAQVEVGSGGKAVTLASGIAVGKCLNGAVNNGNAEIKLY